MLQHLRRLHPRQTWVSLRGWPAHGFVARTAQCQLVLVWRRCNCKPKPDAKEFTGKQRATMGPLNALAGSLAFAVVTIAVGMVADHLGPAKTIPLLGVVWLSVIVIYRDLFRKHDVSGKLSDQ